MAETDTGWRCATHGSIPPLWRAAEASYDGFGEHLRRAGEFPTYLPWPLGLGWQVTDFGVVAGVSGALATVVSFTGVSEQDGPVEVTVVSEEPGTGLGARCAGTVHSDPGAEIGGQAPSLRVRLGSQQVSLWPVSTVDRSEPTDRAVAAGEAHGRWLWLVLRPASAIFLLRNDWALADVSEVGASLLEVPFGGPAQGW